MIATIKEDGVAATIGIRNGRRYISRSGKERTEVVYLYDHDIPDTIGATALRVLASIWFSALGDTIDQSSEEGDRWNVEVLYPNLNVVSCTDVVVRVLHPLIGDHGEMSTPVDRLVYPNKRELIDVVEYLSSDGCNINLMTSQYDATIEPVVPYTINGTIFNDVIAYIDTPYNGGTIADLLTLNLSSISHLDRSMYKVRRDYENLVLSNKLLNVAQNLNIGGREGIVIEYHGELYKIVDPDFVTSNQFHHCVRNCIKPRTFGKQYLNYVPECWHELTFEISRKWNLKTHPTAEHLDSLLQLYLEAHADGLFRGPRGETQLTPTAHAMTLLEFAAMKDELYSS